MGFLLVVWCDDTLLLLHLSSFLDDTRLHVNTYFGWVWCTCSCTCLHWLVFSHTPHILSCLHTCCNACFSLESCRQSCSDLLRVIVLSCVWYLLARLLTPNTPWAGPVPVPRRLGHANMIKSMSTFFSLQDEVLNGICALNTNDASFVVNPGKGTIFCK